MREGLREGFSGPLLDFCQRVSIFALFYTSHESNTILFETPRITQIT